MTMESCRPSPESVLVELRPQPSGFDADDRIEPRVVRLGAPENGDADHIFLDLIAFSGERAVNHIAEKTAHPIGVGEDTARKHAVELKANLVG